MSDRYFLDTNILVYANDSLDEIRQKKAKKIILDGIRNQNIVLSTQVLSEFYVVVTQKIETKLSPKVARKEIELLRILEIVEINFSMILFAIDVSCKYKISYWDSLVIVAAKKAKCPVVYSEDLTAGQKIETIEIVNPFV